MFIIMDAPGWHGDNAQIYSRHETLDAARRALRGRTDRYISTDGGHSDSHQPGQLIHRQFIGAYERVGSRG